MTTFQSQVLVAGEGNGPVLVLSEPLSLWGGLEPRTGKIIDQRHPQSGEVVSQKIMVMPFGKGSSSASSILLEAVKAGTAPAAIVLATRDPILALGAVVANELYGNAPPVVVLTSSDYLDLTERAKNQNLSIRLTMSGTMIFAEE